MWASAPVVMTARHMQDYGDAGLVEETFTNHERWFEFLVEHFDKGLKKKGYDDELRGYTKEGSGLGDWLTFRGRDTVSACCSCVCGALFLLCSHLVHSLFAPSG